jgi:hypothetical protein
MFDFRFMVAVLALFAVSFFGVQWLVAGAPVPLFGIVPLTPDARIPTFVEKSRKDIAAAHERDWLASKTVQSDGDPERDKLRADVIEAATAFTLSPCSDELKRQYFEAAAAYARAFVTLGGCPNYPSCAPDDALMERANQIFRSPADARVKRAIDKVHKMGISIKDYPDKLGPAVSHLSGSGFSFDDAPFSCTSPQARTAKPLDDSPGGTPPPVPVSKTRDQKDIDRDTHEHYRKRMIETLRRPGPAWCSDPERRIFLNGIRQYYGLRDSALHGPAVRTPEEKREIEKAWSSALDQQIDGLVREFLVAGYFSRKDLGWAPWFDQVFPGATSTDHACGNG